MLSTPSGSEGLASGILGTAVSLHVENLTARRVRDVIVGSWDRLRVHGLTARQTVGDVVGLRGYRNRPGLTAAAWLEDLDVRELYSSSLYAGLHQDLVQCGHPQDDHDGYDVLLRRVRADLASGDSGATQGVFARNYGEQDWVGRYVVDDVDLEIDAWHALHLHTAHETSLVSRVRARALTDSTRARVTMPAGDVVACQVDELRGGARAHGTASEMTASAAG
jgi:hypothetical protein